MKIILNQNFKTETSEKIYHANHNANYHAKNQVKEKESFFQKLQDNQNLKDNHSFYDNKRLVKNREQNQELNKKELNQKEFNKRELNEIELQKLDSKKIEEKRNLDTELKKNQEIKSENQKIEKSNSKEVNTEEQKKNKTSKQNSEILLDLLNQLEQAIEKGLTQNSSNKNSSFQQQLKDILSKINALLKNQKNNFLNINNISNDNSSKITLELQKKIEEILNNFSFDKESLSNFLEKNSFSSIQNEVLQKIKLNIVNTRHALSLQHDNQQNNNLSLEKANQLSSRNIDKAKIFADQIQDKAQEQNIQNQKNSTTLQELKNIQKSLQSNLVKKQAKNSSQEKEIKNFNQQINENLKNDYLKSFKLDSQNVSNHEVLNNKEISKKIIHQLNDSLQQAIINNKKITHLQLKPQELGKVEILLHQEQDRIQVKFIVGSESVKEVIDQKVNQIRESLAEKQIEFHSFETEIKKESSENKKGNQGRETQEYYQEHKIISNQKKKTPFSSLDSYNNLSSLNFSFLNDLGSKNLSVSLVA